nr:unnamed protein product [Callosobruchus chinensis]
MKSLKQL